MYSGLTETQSVILKEVNEQLPIVLTLPEPDRSKCLTCLASECIVQDMEEKAFELLDQCDPGYFREPLMDDMKNEPMMSKVVASIIDKLVEMDYVALNITGE